MLVELCSGSLPSFPLEHHWPPTDKKGNPISGQVKDLLDTIRQHCLVEEEKKRSLVNLLQALGVDPLSVTQTPSQPTIAKPGKQEIETKASPSNSNLSSESSQSNENVPTRRERSRAISVKQQQEQPFESSTSIKEGKQEIETKPSPSNQDDVPKGKKN